MSKKIRGIVFLTLIVTVFTTAWLKYGRLWDYVYGIKTNRAQIIADELFTKASIFKKANGYNPKISDIYFPDIEYFDAYDDKINQKCDAHGWGCKSINLRADEVGNFEVSYTYDLYDCSKKETESEWYCFWND